MSLLNKLYIFYFVIFTMLLVALPISYAEYKPIKISKGIIANKNEELEKTKRKQINNIKYFTFDMNCCDKEHSFIWDTLNLENDENIQNMILGKNNIRIGFIKYDLNQDSLMDILVRITSSTHCGSNGCSFYIYLQQDNQQYKKINAPSTIFNKIGISTYTTGNFHDLYFPTSSKKICLWRWSGKKYSFTECIDDTGK